MAWIVETPCLAQERDRSGAGAAEEDDSQEAIPSSSREQIESFIGAVAEKIAPPAVEARPNSVGHFPPRQASHPAVTVAALLEVKVIRHSCAHGLPLQQC